MEQCQKDEEFIDHGSSLSKLIPAVSGLKSEM